MTLSSSNPPVYDVSGWRDLKYANRGTNQTDTLYTGTGVVEGRLDVRNGQLELFWPRGCADCGMMPSGTLWPNTYTGRWSEQTFLGPKTGGEFSAQRR